MLFQYLLVLLIVLSFIIVKKRPKKFINLHEEIKVDFPCVPVIGHAYKFMGNNEDRMTLFDELGRQAYNNKHGAASFWLLNHLCVSISDPVSAKHILKTCFDKWIVSLFMRHLLGNGSIVGAEEIWRLRRKILTPIFAPKYHNIFAKVFEQNSKILVERLAAVVGKGDFSIWEYFNSYALDSAFDMAFGENLNAQKHKNHPFITSLQEYARRCAARLGQPWQYSPAVYKLLPARARQRRHKTVMWDCIHTLIDKKKKAIAEAHLNNTEPNPLSPEDATFLELLIKFSGGENGYSNAELREEALVLVLAASDTTAAAECFAALLLAQRPDVQDRIYDEVQAVLGDSTRSVSVDDVPNLKYLDAVVKETLRLYPALPITLRKCKQDIELPSGIVLPENCTVLLNLWAIHRNPRYWGADADQFKPERFLNATPEQLSVYMPFGSGPRGCTGVKLALTSMKLSLAEITRRYRLAPAPGPRSLRVTYEIVVKHVHNFRVRLESRF